MDYCSQCGARLGIGRFCTNCGARVVASTVPAPPADVPDQPAEPPLERTLVYDAPPVAAAPVTAAPLAAPPLAAPPPARSRDRRPAVVGVGVAVLLVLLVTVAWWARSGQDDPPQVAAGARDGDSASRSGERSAPTGPLEDVAGRASVEAPPPIAPGRSLGGDVVSYAATNLTDGDTSTAYRLRGDATGTVITLRWAEPVRLREVGLVNGYAKTDSANGVAVDWYAANRKVLHVRWTFDDGTSVEQRLRPDPDVQTTEVPDVTTRRVRLELLEVSAPGRGPRSRDTTALSDVVLRAG